MKKLTLETFKAEIVNIDVPEWSYKGTLPAIIDFYADWCGPCKMVKPILDQLETELDGKLVIYQVDVDAEQQLAQLFGITGIPSMLFIPVTGNPTMHTGALPKQELRKLITTVLTI